MEPVLPASNQEPSSARIRRCLEESPLGLALDPEGLTLLGAAARVIHLPGGATLIHQGDPGESAFILSAGRMRVSAATRGGDLVEAEVGPGELIGEIALLADRPRTAAVRAIRDCELLEIPARVLTMSMAQHPGLHRVLSGLVVDRLTAPRPGAPAATVRTIAVVPLTDGLSADAVVRIQASFAKLGGCELVTPERVTAALGWDPLEEALDLELANQFSRWCSELESQARFVLYWSRPDQTQWRLRCLRQADRVLLVARAGADKELRATAMAGLSEAAEGVRRELLILHPPGTVRPLGTAALLQHLDVALHHHARTDRQDDFDRVARLMTGRGTGVVLGGGAARGWAHLGVLRALDELGLRIDAIGGTSIGAVMASAYAAIPLASEREARLRDGMARRRLFPMTLPISSLSSGHAMTDALRSPAGFGDLLMEDCWIPLFMVSTNLTTAQPKLHRDGPIWRAARASASIPGLLPPVCWDGELLVDGAILDNLPVSAMHRLLQGGRVIAVDVEPSIDLKVGRPFEPAISGWRLLLRQWNPLREAMQVPRMAAVVGRAQAVRGPGDGRSKLSEEAGDVLLRPPTVGASAFDFRRFDALVEAGYRHAREVLGGAAQEPGQSTTG